MEEGEDEGEGLRGEPGGGRSCSAALGEQQDEFFTGSGSALHLILERKRKRTSVASSAVATTSEPSVSVETIHQPSAPQLRSALKTTSYTRPVTKRARVAEAAGEDEEESEYTTSTVPIKPRFLSDREAMELLTSDFVLAQYPYMADVAFLVSVICDSTLDDHPIVYVNENFEGMTLFRREEILGRNCRFMQGKCTNPETVKQISESMANKQEMEVEILNYRRNGVPFWNKFLLLPIRGPDREQVLYWCAIQQDITILKEMGSNPKNWTPHEVGMWLDHVDFGDYSLHAVHRELTGYQLLHEPIDRICDMIHMKSDDDKEMLKGKIQFLKEKPELSFSSSSLSGSMLSLQFLQSLSSADGRKRVRFDKATFFHSENRDKITIKCLFHDEVQLFSIRRDATIKRVRNKLTALLPHSVNLKIEGVSKQGHLIPLGEDGELKAFIESILDGNHSLQPKAIIQVHDEGTQEANTPDLQEASAAV